ncbi:hypothetical protein QOT17_019610 [Balamuthia mandrillaris]
MEWMLMLPINFCCSRHSPGHFSASRLLFFSLSFLCCFLCRFFSFLFKSKHTHIHEAPRTTVFLIATLLLHKEEISGRRQRFQALSLEETFACGSGWFTAYKHIPNGENMLEGGGGGGGRGEKPERLVRPHRGTRSVSPSRTAHQKGQERRGETGSWASGEDPPLSTLGANGDASQVVRHSTMYLQQGRGVLS